MPNLGAALTGIGPAVQNAVPGYVAQGRTAIEDQRHKEQMASPANQYQQAVSAEALQQLNQDKQKIKREDFVKSNPYGEHLIEAAKQMGMIVGDEQEFTRGQMKQAAAKFAEKPEILNQVVNKSYAINLQKDTEYSAAIQKKQEELSKLNIEPGDAVLNKGKAEKLQKEIADLQKEREPFTQGRMRDSQMRDNIQLVMMADEYQKMPKEDQVIANTVLKENNGIPPKEGLSAAVLQKKSQIAADKKAKTPFYDKSGKVVLVDLSSPDAQKIIDEKGLITASQQGAETRIQAFGSVPTNTPGVFYDKKNKKYFENVTGPNGKAAMRELTSAEVQQKNLEFTKDKKVITTANSAPFKRIVNNGEILVDGVKDPKTGKMSEPELDKIVRLRNELPDGVFGSISNKLRSFNTWDQFIKYQVSDPKMAKLKSAIIANAERLGAMYSGGGTVTSDQKLKIAMELLDSSLGKEGFAGLIEMHKDSIRSTVNKYKQDAGVSVGGDASGNDPLGLR